MDKLEGYDDDYRINGCLRVIKLLNDEDECKYLRRYCCLLKKMRFAEITDDDSRCWILLCSVNH